MAQYPIQRENLDKGADIREECQQRRCEEQRTSASQRTSQTTRQERGVGQSMPSHCRRTQTSQHMPLIALTEYSNCASYKEKKLSFSQLLSSGSLTSKSPCFINPRWKARVREGLRKSKPVLTA